MAASALLDLSEGLDLAIAHGTLLLAVATFLMTRSTRDLAQTSEKQLELLRIQHQEEGFPKVRLERCYDGSLLTSESAFAGGGFGVDFSLERVSGGAADIVSASLDDVEGELLGGASLRR